MQPSCFVTNGKEELMQTSKNHFEAKVIFNDETIRRMFRTEFYTYEGMQRLVWLAVAFALVMLALFVPIPTVVKVLCLLVGCAMFAMPDFLSRLNQKKPGSQSIRQQLSWNLLPCNQQNHRHPPLWQLLQL